MRKLFVLLFTCAVGLSLLATQSQAQKTEAKKPEDPEKVLERLLRAVKQKDDVNKRVQAIMDLADFGPKAEPALEDLLDALQDKNEDLKLNAAITLSKIGPSAVKPVVRLLKSDDVDTKFYAIWTLGWIGPDAKDAVPAIIKLMADKNEGVRRKAAFALGRLAGDPDKTIAVLVEAFKDASPEVRQAAGDALSKFGKAAVPSLMELLKAKNPDSRSQAALSLGEIGTEAKDAAPLLHELFLKENEYAGAIHYATVLAKLGKAGLPALEAGFKDPRGQVRQASANAMTTMGGEAVGILVDGLGDKNIEVRRLAAQTLAPMRIGDKSVVIALAFALFDADDQLRHNCMSALMQLGPQAKLAAPKLKEALTDKNPQFRQQALSLLQTFNEDLGPTFKKILKTKDAKLRIDTACMMVNMQVEKKLAVPVLIEALEDKDHGLKMQAAFTLAQQQLASEKLLPLFIEGLKQKAPGVRAQAAQGLGVLRHADGAIPLVESLRDSDENVRQQAIQALTQVRGPTEKVMPVLLAVFKDGSPIARSCVLRVVHIYNGEQAVDLVTGALNDKDAVVRHHAVAALPNVGGKPEKILPILTGVYKDGDAEMRRRILSIAHIYGGKSKGLVSDGLKDKEVSVRQQALSTTQNLPGEIEEFVPLVGDLLKDKEVNLRVQAAQVLRNAGAKAAKAMPAIKAALQDENTNVRLNAMLILATVGGEGTDFLIKRFAEEKDVNVRAGVLPNLAYSGHQKVAAPLLSTAMKDPAAQVRQQAIQLLGYFGQGSKEGYEAFTMGLKDSDANVRINSAHFGQFFGEKSWQPMEAALKSSKDDGFRQAILQNLVSSGYRSKTGIAPLTDCLTDKNENMRFWACNLLGNIGPDAVSALPALRQIAKSDANVNVQQAARNAMQRIEPKKEEPKK